MHKLFEIPSIALFLCTFCASLRLTRTVFSRLLKKAISMALWTKASLCVKACPERSRTGSLLEQSLPGTPSRLKTSVISVISVAKNLFNQRNPRLINDLRACKELYNCRETFTDVMRPLQIRLFMQNKPNFRKSQMNVNKVLTRDYENKTLGQVVKTNPKRTQTNPIKANFKKAKMYVNKVLTKEYEKKLNWALYENEPNTKPNKPNLRTEYCKFIDDYPFILYTGVLYKKKLNMEKQ